MGISGDRDVRNTHQRSLAQYAADGVDSTNGPVQGLYQGRQSSGSACGDGEARGEQLLAIGLDRLLRNGRWLQQGEALGLLLALQVLGQLRRVLLGAEFRVFPLCGLVVARQGREASL